VPLGEVVAGEASRSKLTDNIEFIESAARASASIVAAGVPGSVVRNDARRWPSSNSGEAASRERRWNAIEEA
jgi:hypothetical protein